MKQFTTIKLRLKDKHAADLRRQARAVNFVWNYCNETQMKAAQSGRKWLSAFDLINLTAGAGKLLGLSAGTVGTICSVYVESLRIRRLPWLRFRGKKSLGWVPIKGEYLRKRGDRFVVYGNRYVPMHDRPESTAEKYSRSSFNADARGRWYINLCVPDAAKDVAPEASPVGIDLGLNDLAALSTGETFQNPKHLARLADKLGKAQRAGKKRLAATVYAKIKNCRSDFLHKLSNQVASSHNLIVVGNVSSAKLVKTRFAKSVLDAGWATLRRQLSYKSIRNGGRYVEVSEYLTSQTCSECGCMPASRPEGIAGLGIRTFECSECGVSLNRDVNAARNILSRYSQVALAEGAAEAAELATQETG